jgi:hypothetical protein
MRHEVQPRGKLAAVTEDLPIPDTRHQGTRSDMPDSRNRLQSLTGGILAVPGVDFSLHLINLSIKRSEMRATARLHRNEARRQLREKCNHLRALQLLAQRTLTPRIDPVRLKN